MRLEPPLDKSEKSTFELLAHGEFQAISYRMFSSITSLFKTVLGEAQIFFDWIASRTIGSLDSRKIDSDWFESEKKRVLSSFSGIEKGEILEQADRLFPRDITQASLLDSMKRKETQLEILKTIAFTPKEERKSLVDLALKLTKFDFSPFFCSKRASGLLRNILDISFSERENVVGHVTDFIEQIEKELPYNDYIELLLGSYLDIFKIISEIPNEERKKTVEDTAYLVLCIRDKIIKARQNLSENPSHYLYRILTSSKELFTITRCLFSEDKREIMKYTTDVFMSTYDLSRIHKDFDSVFFKKVGVFINSSKDHGKSSLKSLEQLFGIQYKYLGKEAKLSALSYMEQIPQEHRELVIAFIKKLFEDHSLIPSVSILGKIAYIKPVNLPAVVRQADKLLTESIEKLEPHSEEIIVVREEKISYPNVSVYFLQEFLSAIYKILWLIEIGLCHFGETSLESIIDQITQKIEKSPLSCCDFVTDLKLGLVAQVKDDLDQEFLFHRKVFHSTNEPSLFL